MAKQCFLCGGTLRNGRCTECGLDNTKNDRKYQLNTHNESGAHFHDGGCEVQPNKRRVTIGTRRKKQEEEKQETFDYNELLEKEKKKVHPDSSRNKTKTRTATQTAAKSNTKSSRPSGGADKSTGNKKGSLIFWIILIYAILMLLGGNR
jgi:hypothetical protein